VVEEREFLLVEWLVVLSVVFQAALKVLSMDDGMAYYWE
jgi:hypothetical protein